MKLSFKRIYRKTELGVSMLKTRAGPLTAQGRTALILINGRESLAMLTGKIGTEAGALVELLLALRLIEEVPEAPTVLPPRLPPPRVPVMGRGSMDAAVATPPAAAPMDAAAAAALQGRLLPLKREAMNRLAPQFGPDVDVICGPLLAATTERAYRVALAAIESKLSIYIGHKVAQRMLDELRA